MPTTPLPTSITNKIKARTQSVRWAAVLREVREFRAYCCDIQSDGENGIMGVTKQPVIIATISPNPVCLGNAVTIDFTGTYVPGNYTIASKTVDWGAGGGAIAVVGDTASNTYGAVGEYTVIAVVTASITGLSQTINIEVNVIDCSDTLLIASIYAATDGVGVWYWE